MCLRMARSIAGRDKQRNKNIPERQLLTDGGRRREEDDSVPDGQRDESEWSDQNEHQRGYNEQPEYEQGSGHHDGQEPRQNPQEHATGYDSHGQHDAQRPHEGHYERASPQRGEHNQPPRQPPQQPEEAYNRQPPRNQQHPQNHQPRQHQHPPQNHQPPRQQHPHGHQPQHTNPQGQPHRQQGGRPQYQTQPPQGQNQQPQGYHQQTHQHPSQQTQTPDDDGVSRRKLLFGGLGLAGAGAGGWYLYQFFGGDDPDAVAEEFVAAADDGDWSEADSLLHSDSMLSDGSDIIDIMGQASGAGPILDLAVSELDISASNSRVVQESDEQATVELTVTVDIPMVSDLSIDLEFEMRTDDGDWRVFNIGLA